jgi:hypothetical protein
MNHSEIGLGIRQGAILLSGIALLAYGVFGLSYRNHSRAPVLVSLIIFVALSGILVGSFLIFRESE